MDLVATLTARVKALFLQHDDLLQSCLRQGFTEQDQDELARIEQETEDVCDQLAEIKANKSVDK